MGVRLTVKMKSGSGAETKTVLLDEETILFGRDQACQVVLAQQAVSRNHARISRDGTLFFLEDLGSSFGTQVNGQKLPKGEKRLLRNGDIIAIAQFDVTFDRVADVSTEDDASNKTSFLSRKVVKDVMKGLAAGGENAYFRIMNGTAEGQRIEIADAQEYVFGRDASEADIVLNDDLVSRKHVKVRRDWSGTHVEDLGSRNGIKLNKKRTRKATIKDRDELEIGGVRLLFIDPSEVREDPVVLPSSTGEDEGEGTLSVKHEEDAPPSVEVKQEDVEPEKKEEEPAAEPAENASTDAEAPAEDAENAEAPPEDQPADEPAEEAPAPSGKLIDFNNKQHLIALGIGGVMLLLGIIVIVLLVAGV
ncbi:MAG: FHA domain-containing protein [Archangium sp.]|nr:FHA domain-containing protein [Archangium sp.]